ncbi:MAG: hypothetical protein QOH50_1612 [Kribbellaceae bacterium]|jgi:hypothetical protein|nr:hypothetical protein [Kribbellaceae bacterium]
MPEGWPAGDDVVVVKVVEQVSLPLLVIEE